MAPPIERRPGPRGAGTARRARGPRRGYVQASVSASEIATLANHPAPYRIPVIGWPMSRSAGLHPCSPGTVIADTMSVVAHGPSCAVIPGSRAPQVRTLPSEDLITRVGER